MTLRNFLKFYFCPVVANRRKHNLLLLPVAINNYSTWCPNFQTRRMESSSRKIGGVTFEDTITTTLPMSQRRFSNSSSSGAAAAAVDTSDPVQLAKAIFFQGVENVIPSRLINSQVQLQGSLLKLANPEKTCVDLSQYNKKYVVGFGKGCLPMAESFLTLLNGLVDRCIVSVPVGSRESTNSNIEIFRGAENNIPDEGSFTASQAIVQLVQSCTPKDLLVILISGGGSALLPYPIPPITLEEKKNLIKQLSRAGCTIHELNTVRKRISLVKGGGLIRMCPAGKIISMIVSDVAGNPMDIIASGATVENPDSPSAALGVIEKYNLEEGLPQSILNVVSQPPPPVSPNVFHKVTNFIIGDNQIALEGAAGAATGFGLQPVIVTSTMGGLASEVGYDLASVSESIAYCLNRDLKDDSDVKALTGGISRVFKNHNWSTDGILPDIAHRFSASKGICLLFGGETTVKVSGRGIGGRNQELVLSAGIRLDSSRNLAHVKSKIAILCAGTDGIDGPTNAAGGVVEYCTIHNAQLQGISPVEHLKDNDSYHFFKSAANGKYHIICGHTETNVMDVAVVVILKKGVGVERTKSML